MNVLTLARLSILRTVRERTSLFFIVALPLLVIVLVGASSAGQDHLRIGLAPADPAQADGPVAMVLTGELSADGSVDLRRYDSVGALRTAVRRSEVAAGVVLPVETGASGTGGENVAPTVGMVVQPASSVGFAARSKVAAVVAEVSAELTALDFTVERMSVSEEQARQALQRAQAIVPALTTRIEAVDAERRILPSGYASAVPTMLVLFVFVNALAAGGVIIQNRQLGVYDRILAAPVRPGAVIRGEAVTYLCIALIQSSIVVAAGWVLFGVDWGSPVAVVALVVAWAAVGAAAGMVLGTVLRTPEQSSAIGPAIGIVLGMLGGCMWPLEIVPDTMVTVGHLTPHAWAVDGWVELVARGGGVSDIARELAVLLGFALVLGVLAAHRLRRVMTG